MVYIYLDEGRALFLPLAPYAVPNSILSRVLPRVTLNLGCLSHHHVRVPPGHIHPRIWDGSLTHVSASLTGLQQLTCLFVIRAPFPPSVTLAPMKRDLVQTAAAAANAKIKGTRGCVLSRGTIQTLNCPENPIISDGQHLAAGVGGEGRWLGVGSPPSRPMPLQGVLEVTTNTLLAAESLLGS